MTTTGSITEDGILLVEDALLKDGLVIEKVFEISENLVNVEPSETPPPTPTPTSEP